MNICIYGYGLEGRSTETFLNKHFPESDLTIVDEKVKGAETFEPEKYDLIFVSPGINRQQKIEKKYWQKCTSQIEYFFSLLTEEKRKRVIGITGSKGKSTTTKLLTEFLRATGFEAQSAGNFGVPFLDVLDDFVAGKVDYIIAEISSYQAEFLQKSPHISIFLSFFPEHLDRHGSSEAYLSAKANCWRYQQDGDFLVFPEVLAPFTALKALCPNDNRLILAPPLSPTYFAEDSVFRADHFCQNFGVIPTVAQILNIPEHEQTLKKVTDKFVGLPHRSEFVGEKLGMKFYNDSIATAPKATASALHFFKDKVGYLFLGGENGGDSFDELLSTIKKRTPCVKIFVTQSGITPFFEASAKKLNFRNYEIVSDFKTAMEQIKEKPLKGKITLLSPAGKSFDQYRNYAERGDHFRKMVAEI